MGAIEKIVHITEKIGGGVEACEQTKKATGNFRLLFAVRTGLEPATPCVTGMYSNQAELPHHF